MTLDLALTLPLGPKALATVLAFALLWIGELVRPAHEEGRGGLVHDVRNLAFGVMNASMVAALLLWVLPTPDGTYGLLGWWQPGVVVGAVVVLLGLDLWMYVWHRANHRIPFLWRFHRVHHADPRMDATTAVRFHPGEAFLATLGRLPVAYGLGASLAQVFLYEAVLLPVILLHHSNVRLPRRLDRALRTVLVMPSLHRVHHSPDQEETDSNYGSVLTVWDRLARTFRRPGRAPAPRYGLRGLGGPEDERLGALLALPFRGATR